MDGRLHFVFAHLLLEKKPHTGQQKEAAYAVWHRLAHDFVCGVVSGRCVGGPMAVRRYECDVLSVVRSNL